MKKIVKIISVVLIVLIGACFFVACGEKKPVLKGVFTWNRVYKTKDMTGFEDFSGPYLNHGKDTIGYFIDGFETNKSPIYSFTYRPNLTVKSVKDLPQDKIVYTTADRSGIKNGVVVNKWMYYYSLMVANGEMVDPEDEKHAAANEALDSDALTMEKAALDILGIYNAVAKEPIYPDLAIIQIETYKRNLPPYNQEILDSMEQLFSCDRYTYWGRAEEGEVFLCPGFMEEYQAYLEVALNYEYEVDRSQLKVAAMQRYGYIDVNQMERGIGKLKVWYDTDAPQIGEKDAPILEEIPVIGYYESEADKLMSTGVPRDVQSDAYKLVFAQLYNPTFYVV